MSGSSWYFPIHIYCFSPNSLNFILSLDRAYTSVRCPTPLWAARQTDTEGRRNANIAGQGAVTGSLHSPRLLAPEALAACEEIARVFMLQALKLREKENSGKVRMRGWFGGRL